MTPLAAAAEAVGAFTVTNIDDFVVLTTLFAQPGRGPGTGRIVSGQYLGMGALVAVSALAAAGLATVPERWVGLLGLVPLVLGVRGLLALRRRRAGEPAVPVVRGLGGVAALTVANGGDNVAVYIPLLHRSSGADTAITVVVFAALVGIWCAAARAVAGHPRVTAGLERTGHWLVPTVYVVLGLRIVLGSGLLP